MRLPPGLTSKDFSDALKEFSEAVGKDWVFSSDEDVDLYRDSYSPFWHEAEEPIPAGAVAPDSVEQVQKVVRIAGKYKIPLWTISTGKNLAYGGSAPQLSGSVVLDLKRMNRILEVNERNHYALVEPGVSYFDFYRYISERKLKVWIDPPDPGWGSVIGNALERGCGFTPMHDHFDAHCGMEIVLANGEVLRTGMGALPNSKTWQQYKYGFGPYLDGMFSQSNFGVVTKMGFWLYPEPEAYFSGNVTVPKRDDVHALVEIFAYLTHSSVVQGTTAVIAMPSFVPSDPQLDTVRQSGSTKAMEDYLAQKGMGYWSLDLPFYGPAKVVAAQWEYAQEKFSTIPGARFREVASHRFPLDAEQLAKIADPVPLGVPSLGVFMNGGPSGHGHMDFSPCLPMTGEAVLESLAMLDNAYRDMGSPKDAPPGVPVFAFFPRAFVILYWIPIEQDVEKNKRSREVFRGLVKTAAEHGWGEYRTHTAFMNDVMDVYSFNDHALRRLDETIKDALDPDGILAPGKNGIWPKRLRKARA